MPVSGASVVPSNDILNIVVDEPDWKEEVSDAVVVAGEARVFEGVVNIRIRNSNDKILADTFATVASPDIGEFGSFSKTVGYTSPGTSFGYVEVFDEFARDGSEIYKVITLIRF